MVRDVPNRHLTAFGAAVRELRKERGVSQERLADDVGIHRTYMGGVERGERNVSLLNIWRIAAALDVPPSRLLALAESLGSGSRGGTTS